MRQPQARHRRVKAAVIFDRVQNLVVPPGRPDYPIVMDHLQRWASLINGNVTILMADVSELDILPGELIGAHRSGVEIINVGLPNAEEIDQLFVSAEMEDTQISQAQRVDLIHRLHACDCMRILDYFKTCRRRKVELNLRTLRELTSRTDDLWPTLLIDDALTTLHTKLQEKILGQEVALRKVIDTLRRVRHRLAEQVNNGTIDEKPLAYFFFAGPTGVGKTEVFRVLCEELKGIASRKINMTEYAQEHAVMRLLGAPPSYRGDPKGELGQFLLDNPACILLFDEFEKAHERTWMNFLTMLEGGFTTGDGTKIDLSQTILCFTSNAGSAALRRMESDMSDGQQANIRQHNSDIVRQALYNAGAPRELIGRLLEAITPFNHLTRAVVERIIDLHLHHIGQRLAANGCLADFHASVRAYLLDFYEREKDFGARALTQHIEGTLYSEILAWLSSH